MNEEMNMEPNVKSAPNMQMSYGGENQGARPMVSDKDMKVFIKNCKGDPVMRKVAALVAKKAK